MRPPAQPAPMPRAHALAPVDFDPFRGGEVVLAAPATEAQREIWLASQLGDAATCAFNESIWLRLRGAIDPALVQAALYRLIERHDALRSVFSDDGRTLCVLQTLTGAIDLVDLSGSGSAVQEARLAALRRE